MQREAIPSEEEVILEDSRRALAGIFLLPEEGIVGSKSVNGCPGYGGGTLCQVRLAYHPFLTWSPPTGEIDTVVSYSVARNIECQLPKIVTLIFGDDMASKASKSARLFHSRFSRSLQFLSAAG